MKIIKKIKEIDKVIIKMILIDFLSLFVFICIIFIVILLISYQNIIK